MNILFIQTGDYAEAFERFQAGDPETYRDQKASVDYVANLAQENSVVVAARAEQRYERELRPGLRAIGMLPQDLNRAGMLALLDREQPDRLIIRSPFLGALQAARLRCVPTLPTFADLFQPGGLRTWWRQLLLRRALSGPHMPCVANHSLNASLSTVHALRIAPGRVLPWDWRRIPAEPKPKPGPADADRPALFFAGALSESKGVGDCLSALRLLHDRGTRARFTFAGPGDLVAWRDRAAGLGLAEFTSFPGAIPNRQVRDEMHRHDIVVVPSRHSYPEGLPNTIYEALASRSPLVLSDHPAFSGRLAPGRDCEQFRAADPASLADAVQRTISSATHYAALSAVAAEALNGLYIGIDWMALVDLFLADPENRSGWVEKHALPALLSPADLAG